MYDQLERSYSVNEEIRIKTPMLIADLCHLGDAYIFVKVVIAVTDADGAKRNKSVAFKNNAPFINYISKINNVLIDNAVLGVRSCDVNVQFAWIQRKLWKNNS